MKIKLEIIKQTTIELGGGDAIVLAKGTVLPISVIYSSDSPEQIYVDIPLKTPMRFMLKLDHVSLVIDGATVAQQNPPVLMPERAIVVEDSNPIR